MPSLATRMLSGLRLSIGRWWWLLALGLLAGLATAVAVLAPGGIPTTSAGIRFAAIVLAIGAAAGCGLAATAVAVVQLIVPSSARRPVEPPASRERADEHRTRPAYAPSVASAAPAPASGGANGRAARGHADHRPIPTASDVARPRRAAAAGPVNYIALAKQWWWVLAVGSVLGVAGTFGYMQVGPVPYQSRAQVIVPIQGDIGLADDALGSPTRVRQAAANFAAQAASPRVLELAGNALQSRPGFATRDLLLLQQNGRIDIRAQREANLVDITVTDTDPATAALVADTIATVFVEDVNQSAQNYLQQRQAQLTQQIDLTRQQLLTAQLQQRERDVLRELWTQRTQLLQIQTQYQQELQRQFETDRIGLPPQPGMPAPSPEQQQRLAQLRDAQAEVRTEWLRLLGEQRRHVETNLVDLNGELGEVRGTLQGRGAEQDPALSSAFASAYSVQLQNLTKEYARLEMNAETMRAPLQRWGTASEPLPSLSLKKALPIGAGAGLALGAALIYLLDVWRRRRSAVAERAVVAHVTEVPHVAEPVVANGRSKTEKLSRTRMSFDPRPGRRRIELVGE